MSKSIFDRQLVTAPLAPVATPYGSASTSAVQIHYRGLGKFVVSFTPSTDCYIKFGTATVGAASSSDWPLTAGKRYRLSIDNSSTYFRVIRKTDDGVLDWFVEGAPAFPSSGEILGSLFVDEWISDVTASAATWTSTGARNLAGQNTPTWGVDGTNFGSRKVIGSVQSSNKYFLSGALTGLPAAGGNPYIYGVFRATNDPGVQVFASFGTAAVEGFRVLSVGGTLKGEFEGTAVNMAALDSLIHFVEVWGDGTNVNVAIDGVKASSASTSTLANTIVKVAVGGKCNATDAPSDAFHARWGICSAAPSDTQRALLFANMRAYYAF